MFLMIKKILICWWSLAMGEKIETFEIIVFTA